MSVSRPNGVINNNSIQDPPTLNNDHKRTKWASEYRGSKHLRNESNQTMGRGVGKQNDIQSQII